MGLQIPFNSTLSTKGDSKKARESEAAGAGHQSSCLSAPVSGLPGKVGDSSDTVCTCSVEGSPPSIIPSIARNAAAGGHRGSLEPFSEVHSVSAKTDLVRAMHVSEDDMDTTNDEVNPKSRDGNPFFF